MSRAIINRLKDRARNGPSRREGEIIPPIPYRIRLGVTGHRYLPDEARLAERLRQIILTGVILGLYDDKSKNLLDQTEVDICYSILTPLAEGADRLVAKEVLKLPNSSIEVVLPLTKEDYWEDFKTDESRAEFDFLYGRDRNPYQLRDKKLKDEYPKESSLKEARRVAYEDVGHFVVNNCDVLIALWDGKEVRGRGGTADIVKYAIDRHRPVIIISTLDPDEFCVNKGKGLNADSFRKIYMFNSVKISGKDLADSINRNYKDLFDSKEGKAIPDETMQDIRNYLLPYYVKASKAAKINQHFFHRTGLVVYCFSALAVSASAVGTLFLDLSPVAYSIELSLLFIALLAVFLSGRRQVQDKWIENRFLTERIRSSIFFSACGFEIPRIGAPYVQTDHLSERWTLTVLDEIWKKIPKSNSCDRSSCASLIAFVREAWIHDQLSYHKGKTARANRTGKRLERGGLALLSLALFSPIAHLAFFYPNHMLIHVSWLENVNTFTALSLPAISASIAGFISHHEYSRIAKRSKSMSWALTEIDESIKKTNDVDVLKTLLGKMDNLMRNEAEDWMILMSEVELRSTG